MAVDGANFMPWTFYATLSLGHYDGRLGVEPKTATKHEMRCKGSNQLALIR